MEALTKAEPTKPFKIKETYKTAWEARAAADEHEHESEKPTIKNKGKSVKSKKPKILKGKKSKTLVPSGPSSSLPKKRANVEAGSAYEPHVYREQRDKFIAAAREKGSSYTMANTAWCLSTEKAALLCGLSVNELIRRRFLPAGSTSNPWS